MGVNTYFIDSNILIYAMGNNDQKKQRTLELLFNQEPIISTQVINECSNVLRKKFKLEYRKISEIIDNYLCIVKLVPVHIQTIKLAWIIGEKYGYSYYDCLIIASALENNCNPLYSEDLQHNQMIENKLRVLNPFC